MSDPKTQFKLVALIQKATILADSVLEDISQDGIVSDDTINNVDDFNEAYEELSQLLDLENADKGGKYEC